VVVLKQKYVPELAMPDLSWVVYLLFFGLSQASQLRSGGFAEQKYDFLKNWFRHDSSGKLTCLGLPLIRI
jgi:hypothetical protein